MRPITDSSAGLIAMVVFVSCVCGAGARAAQDAPDIAPPKGEQPMTAPTATRPAEKDVGGAPKHTNRLAKETSPYLLQHAHNPVDWHPWGPEAFEAARVANKPIFLSIGYSTCYWCHVMERESFENEDIAAIMNEHYICIKVDREERPDVDDIYMVAVQMMSGGAGGWPMSVFLEPATLKPFLAGTYFPPYDNFGRPGFPSVLKHVASIWKDQRELAIEQANQLADAVKSHLAEAKAPVPIGSRHVEKAVASLLASYDREDGGFVGAPGMARAPKFPMPTNLDFLMSAAWDLKSAKDAVTNTLDRMAMGGMYDQIGGGFHRYSVDEKWLVPHFEKMLYDNAQLASTYVRAFELTKDPYYAEIVRETLDYVLREMTSSEGAFYSAQDAEVNAQEGGNYLWLEQEVREALAAASLKDDIEFALDVYGFGEGTNFQDPHSPEAEPKNVVHLTAKPDALSKRLGMPLEQFNARLERVNKALLAVRDKREQPGTDDKVLASWNGLMIAGMAEGGKALGEKKYTDAAAKAAQFVLKNMRSADGGLLRSRRAGQARIDAFLEDYAFMIRGLIALHRASGDRRVLEDAKKLAQQAKARFWDESGGAYFDTLEGQSDLFVRVKSAHDGALPGGNSVMLLNLLDLHELTGHVTYLDDADATLKALSSTLAEQPTSSILAALGLHQFASKYAGRLDPSQVAQSGKKPGVGFGKAPPVQVAVEPNEIQVKPGAPATFNIKVTISKPFHIMSSKPGDEFLIPLAVKLTGCEGLALTAEYPAGEAYSGKAVEGTVNVHHGSVTIPVRIEQTGKFSGRPQITVTYQACNETECQDPKTEVVGLRIIAQK